MRRPLAVALLSTAALAHDIAHPRHEALRLSPAGLRLLVDYEVPAGGAARALREAFDRNHDGALDPGEQRALAEHLARTAILRTELRIDGAKVPLRRDAVRPEKVDEPVSSGALLAVRVDLSAQWPAEKKLFFFFRRPRQVELRDEDQTGHVPAGVECEGCRVTGASSGVADGSLVRGASTPLRLSVEF